MPGEENAVEETRVTVQQPARKGTVGGSVSEDEEREILTAFNQAGFRTKSQGARAVFLAYSRSTQVRDAVAEFLRDNFDAAS